MRIGGEVDAGQCATHPIPVLRIYRHVVPRDIVKPQSLPCGRVLRIKDVHVLCGGLASLRVKPERCVLKGITVWDITLICQPHGVNPFRLADEPCLVGYLVGVLGVYRTAKLRLLVFILKRG